MNRKQFLNETLKLSLGCCAVCAGTTSAVVRAEQEPADAPAPPAPEPSRLQQEKDFTDNWLNDLMDTIESECDPATQVRLIEGCGRGCYRRHKFKQDVARAAGGTVEGLLAAGRKIWEMWETDGDIHIRFGEVSTKCWCPVLKKDWRGPNDLHCHCTKATLQSVVENGLRRNVRMEILETVRRGGRTCHFIARLG